MIEVSSGGSKVVQHCLGQVVVRTEKYLLHINIVHTHFTLIVDRVDIKALVYVFFKKDSPERAGVTIDGDKHDGEFRLAWVHIRQHIL